MDIFFFSFCRPKCDGSEKTWNKWTQVCLLQATTYNPYGSASGYNLTAVTLQAKTMAMDNGHNAISKVVVLLWVINFKMDHICTMKRNHKQ